MNRTILASWARVPLGSYQEVGVCLVSVFIDAAKFLSQVTVATGNIRESPCPHPLSSRDRLKIAKYQVGTKVFLTCVCLMGDWRVRRTRSPEDSLPAPVPCQNPQSLSVQSTLPGLRLAPLRGSPFPCWAVSGHWQGLTQADPHPPLDSVTCRQHPTLLESCPRVWRCYCNLFPNLLFFQIFPLKKYLLQRMMWETVWRIFHLKRLPCKRLSIRWCSASYLSRLRINFLENLVAGKVFFSLEGLIHVLHQTMKGT